MGGPLVANSAAPFSLVGLSPAPILIFLAIVLGQAFFAWSNRRVAANKQPLLAMEILDSQEEKGAVIAFLVAGSLGLAVGFLIRLYVQIIQGRTPLFSAVAILPYAVAIAAAGVLSVRLYDRFAPRSLGIASFVLIAIGLVMVAFTVGDDWSTIAVILGLLLVGIGEGTLLTLLFNVLLSASPKRLAGDVGALRGVANNVSNALGAAFASVVAVGLSQRRRRPERPCWPKPKDAGKRQAWAKRGAAFLRGRSQRTASAPDRDTGRAPAQPGGAQPARARHDMRTWQVERRKRTRHLIELGGLVVKAGIVDLTGDDRAMIYGALLWWSDKLQSDQRLGGQLDALCERTHSSRNDFAVPDEEMNPLMRRQG